ncbi:HPr-rel-A system PqqD family peptide chaperone [Sphingomonas sp. IC-11]|uniref:HPr-rel-A system PqqD family peptide chaperone n=1 Tax=Sphingomonas sp. IC-11 TaxID=2898528 RepID=UPI001E394394|nr:HPr-rel-A system PqqD family peptide chaperone [Sphingomonas sp. IC-11]MCD2315918.1 HPr-rel-A system PqqD family peptide chaperone [Sphingomonas sp. IC-11]
MGATRYRAPQASDLLMVHLDELVAVFHRAAGITHLVASPVPELLTALSGRWLTLDRIEEEFELVDGDRTGLAAIMDELAAAGLIERRA